MLSSLSDGDVHLATFEILLLCFIRLSVYPVLTLSLTNVFFQGEWGGREVQDRISLCILGFSGTHFVDQAGLELRDLPTSASHVLKIKDVCHCCLTL